MFLLCRAAKIAGSPCNVENYKESACLWSQVGHIGLDFSSNGSR